jgi:hypothetical protein
MKSKKIKENKEKKQQQLLTKIEWRCNSRIEEGAWSCPAPMMT